MRDCCILGGMYWIFDSFLEATIYGNIMIMCSLDGV